MRLRLANELNDDDNRYHIPLQSHVVTDISKSCRVKLTKMKSARTVGRISEFSVAACMIAIAIKLS